MSIRSHRSTAFSFSGATGLFMTHGSIRMSLRLALRTFHVPCPIQVKLTSALSGIRDPPGHQEEEDSPGRKSRFCHSPKTKTAIAATVQRLGKKRSQG